MVTVPGLGITNAFSVAAGAVTNVDLDPCVMMADYDVVETNGIHVTASQPVSVYGVDYDPMGTAQPLTVYPTTLLGTNYCVMARAANIYDYGDGNTIFPVCDCGNGRQHHGDHHPFADGQSCGTYQCLSDQPACRDETYQIGTSNDGLHE